MSNPTESTEASSPLEESTTLRDRLLTGSRVVAGLAFVLLLFAPFFVNTYYIFLLTGILFVATVTATWDFFTGLSGYFNFGHMFLVGLAGYTSALLNAEVGLSIWTSILVATLLTGLVGTIVIAGPSMRLGGIYFAVLTLILPIYGENLVILFSDTTGGLGGYIFVFPLAPELEKVVPLPMDTDIVIYYLALFNFAIIVGLLVLFAKSGLGRILEAIRQEELLVSSLGINPTKFKVTGFAVTALFTGFTGAVWTHYLVTLNPGTQLSIETMIDIIIAAVIGGMGTVVGPVLGLFILEFIDWGLVTVQNSPDIPTFGIRVSQYRRSLTLLLAIGFFYLYPEGVYRPLKERLDRLGNRIKGGDTDE